jgi:hypothetical protein
MRDAEACLKPGGIVIFIDGDQTAYQEDMVTPVAVGQEREEGGDPNEGSWLHRIMRGAHGIASLDAAPSTGQ